MGRTGKDSLKRGLAAAALLFTAAFCVSGCGKADRAYDQAVEFAENGNYEKAVDSFEKAIQYNGEKAEYYIGYGMTLNHMGKYKKAVKQFEKAYQEMDNQISRTNNKQLYYGEALAYYGMHQFDKAIERCNDALEISGQAEIDGNVYATMAVAYLASGDTEKALDSFNRLIKENKKDVEGYLQRGQVYLYLGEQESACRDFSQAIQLDKTCYDAYFGLYDAYTQAGQTDAAKESLEMLTEISAKSAEQKMQVGRAWFVLGEEDQAIRYLEEAAEHQCSEGNYYLGMVQMAKEEYAAALEYFTLYLEETDAITIPEVYSQLAGCLIEQKEYDQAEKYLEQGLQLGLTRAYQGLLRNQVILLERQQKFTAAKKAAKTYLEAYPEDADMQKELQFIETRIKKKKTTGNSSNTTTETDDSEDTATESDSENTTGSSEQQTENDDAASASEDSLDATATPMQ